MFKRVISASTWPVHLNPITHLASSPTCTLAIQLNIFQHPQNECPSAAASVEGSIWTVWTVWLVVTQRGRSDASTRHTDVRCNLHVRPRRSDAPARRNYNTSE